MIGQLWKLYRLYAPASTQKPTSQSNINRTFGPFRPTYRTRIWRRPKNDDEAQQLYNHFRSISFLLDASPLLTDLGLPFKAGLDDVVSLVPLYGDAIGAALGLYGIWLAFLFGCPMVLLGWMLLNTILDFVLGIVPLLGDVLDNLFKANIRNLRLLEDHLLVDRTYNILLCPLGNDFLPRPQKPGFFARKAREGVGRGRFEKGSRTRRMESWEGAVETDAGGAADGLDLD